MTDEEKEKYRGGLIATCKIYCHIDYDDDIEILELMLDTTLDEMTELVQMVNKKEVSAADLLSNRVFFYDGRKLTVASEEVKQAAEALEHTVNHKRIP